MTVTITWSLLGTVAAAIICLAAVGPGTWRAAHGRFYVSPVTWGAWAALVSAGTFDAACPAECWLWSMATDIESSPSCVQVR